MAKTGPQNPQQPRRGDTHRQFSAGPKIFRREIALSQVANAVDDHFLPADFEHRAMGRFVAQPEVQLADNKIERVAFSGDDRELWVLR